MEEEEPAQVSTVGEPGEDIVGSFAEALLLASRARGATATTSGQAPTKNPNPLLGGQSGASGSGGSSKGVGGASANGGASGGASAGASAVSNPRKRMGAFGNLKQRLRADEMPDFGEEGEARGGDGDSGKVSSAASSRGKVSSAAVQDSKNVGGKVSSAAVQDKDVIVLSDSD